MSIYAGTDIQNIDDFRKIDCKKHEDFYRKLFTEQEMAYCLKKPDPYPSFACRFSAKEAVIKAMGQMEKLTDMEILMRDSMPTLSVKGKKIKKSSVSMSHTKDTALATVVLWD